MTPNEQQLFPQGRLSGNYTGKLHRSDASATDAAKDLVFGDVKIDVSVKDLMERSAIDPGIPKIHLLFKDPIEAEVNLRYLDGSIKVFNVKLKKVALRKPEWKESIRQGKKTNGKLEGELIGYFLGEERSFGNWWKWGLGVVVSILLYLLLPMIQPYFEEQKKERIVRDERRESSLQQKDSFNLHLIAADKFANSNEPDAAIQEYKKALEFATPREQKIIYIGMTQSYSGIAGELEKKGNYKQAINVYITIININPFNPKYLYKRALCYVETGQTQKAVDDLKSAIHLGYPAARIMLEKVNPVKKRIKGYANQCCDGTISYSSGSGTCSHHGGICDDTYPLYEDYREFE